MPFDTFTVPGPELERALSEGLGRAVRVTGLRRLAGGMVNSVLVASIDSPPGEIVLKLSKKPDAFSHEAAVLRWFAANTDFPVPRVLAERSAAFGMLAVERLPGVNLAEARALGGDFRACEREMAEAVARLHGLTREGYGGVLAGERFATWAEDFSRKFALFDDPITRERLDDGTVERCRGIAAGLAEVLPERGPPRLVHGDIWATNVIVRRGEGGWRLSGFVDMPGAQYADPEFELAYILVFSTAGRDFFERYADFHEIDEGFAFRRLVYHLHTMLVHVWYFGDAHYRASARDLAARVAAELGVG